MPNNLFKTDSTDLGQILQEAQHRWLRPTEICEILRNYQKFHLTPDPPVRPPGCYQHFVQLLLQVIFHLYAAVKCLQCKSQS